MSSKAEVDNKKVDVKDDVQSQLNESIAKFDNAKKEIEQLVAEKTELQKEVARLNEVNKVAEKELSDIKKSAIANERLATLKSLTKVDDEKSTLDELKQMSDEVFAVVIKYAGSEKKVETKVDEDATNDAEEVLSKAQEVAEPSFNADENSGNKLAEVAMATANLLVNRKRNNEQKGV